MSALDQVRTAAERARDGSSDEQVKLLAECVVSLVAEVETAQRVAQQALEEARKNRPRFS